MNEKQKRLPTLEDAQGAFARIPKQWILVFVAACIFFVIVHAGFFDDRMVNEDYRHYITRNLVNVAAGRFFDFYLITTYFNSWTLGCEACLYLALSSVMIVDMLRIRTKIGAVLSAALIVGMPALAYMFSFLFSVPLYGRLYFLAVLAVWMTDRWRWGFIPGAISLACSLGVGQASLIAAAVLCVLILLKDILFDEEFSYKKLLNKTVRCLIMGVCGVLIYLLIWRLLCNIKNIEISNYDGMDQIGHFTIQQLGSSFLRSYSDFFKFFFGSRFFYVSRIQKVVYVLLFIAIGFSGLYTAIRKPERIPGLVIAALMIPPAVGCIDILAPQVTTDTLMVYPIVFAGVLAIRLAEDAMPRNRLGTGFSWLLIAALLITCLSNLDITSAFYIKAETFHEQTAAYENRLLSRIESTPGYYPGIPVAIINDSSSEYKGEAAANYTHVLNDRDMWYSYVGTYTNVMKKTINLIKVYTGVTLKSASDSQVNQIRSTPEYQKMSAYPYEGSIQIINGVLTVNTVYREIAVSQANENTVLLSFISHVPSENGNDYEYAWYVYRDGERVPELERGYRAVPEHLITLTEDGTYYFKGFRKQGDNKQSINSFKINVKNGSIVSNDVRLRKTSMEEATGRALPPVQINVTPTGDRAVSLTIIDNTLHAGPEFTYAWRVYHNGEHLTEFDRAFASEAQYDLQLIEDGTYQFELIYRKGDADSEGSALTEEIEIMHELEILRVNDNTVMLDYVGPAADSRGIAVAWYVYKDNERINDLSRDYQSNPEHLVSMKEDGAYTFKCVYSINGETHSIMCYPVIVKDGVIEEDSRLGQISMKEALERVRPEVEVQVTRVGDRGVKLTMLDNTLHPGPEYTYAWYVYLNGERVKEYDRGYLADPEYDLILQEDGEYRFKLFYRVGDIKSTVMSEIITVGQSQSAGNAA